MAIYFDKSTKTFYLEGRDITYAFFVNRRGYLEHLYFGKKISRDNLLYTRSEARAVSFEVIAPGEDATLGNDIDHMTYNNLPSELTFFGNGDYRESTVQAEDARGCRIIEPLYYSHEILSEKPAISGMPSTRGGTTLVVHLQDAPTGFSVDLYYTVFEDCDCITRRIAYKNGTEGNITLDRAYSFLLSLPTMDYDVLTLEGAWAAERTPDITPMRHGVVSCDSKRASSSAVNNPFMALLSRGCTEDSGEAIGVSLVYSSSFVLKAQGLPDGTGLVTGGINDFDFSWLLCPGEVFETPEVILAYSSLGIGGMSRALHDLMREHLINPRYVKKSRPIVINNWEGTYFDFNTEKLKAIASAVQGTGIDTFVLDDGWFGKRDNDLSGLGDWVVNTRKLPGGLKPLIDHLHSIGMKFGLWFEPEMISVDSDIYRAHPEYAVSAPGRENCYARHQLVMDLTNPAARDYIVESVNLILHENEIDYVKWDFNRNPTEFYSPTLPPEGQKEFSHRFALGVYDLFHRIVEANPGVIFEGCSGGGSRFDPGVLYYFPQIWTSDNSDAESRTLIQYGTSLVYPLSAMSCHLSVSPNHQTGRVSEAKTRADIAHLGATGYELDTSAFTEEDRADVRRQIAEYKEMEGLVLEGDLYRIDDPFGGNFFSVMLVSKDKSCAHMTVYRRLGGANPPIHRVKAKGLDEKKKYYVPELGMILGGDVLMSVGIVPKMSKQGDFRTVTYHFEEK